MIWINIEEPDRFFGITYVGVSRVKNLNNLLIDSFDRKRFIPSESVKNTLNMLMSVESKLKNMYQGNKTENTVDKIKALLHKDKEITKICSTINKSHKRSLDEF